MTPSASAREFVVELACGTMVGYVALSHEVGVWPLHCVIDETQRRKGIGTEACRALIIWGRRNGFRVIAEPLDKPESKALVAKLVKAGALPAPL